MSRKNLKRELLASHPLLGTLRELPGVQPLERMMGIDQRFCETLLARTPTRKRVGPVSPLFPKNVPPGRFLNGQTLSGSIPPSPWSG